MLRLAAHAGCGTCAEAVGAGLAGDEESTQSLVELGVCAAREGDLALARRALELARPWVSANMAQASPFHAMLARYHLAGVLAKQGDVAAARAEYGVFLDHWGNADRPLPEVVAARKALAELPP